MSYLESGQKNLLSSCAWGLKILCIVVLSLILLLQPSLVLATEAADKLDQLLAEQAELDEQWRAAQEQLSAFEDQKALEESDLAWLNERSAEQKALYEKQLKQVASVTRIKQSLQRNLEIAIRQYENYKVLYTRRIESMYNLQKKSQLEMLLESDNLQSYFTKLRLMKLISDADEQDLQKMREARDRLEKQKAETTRQLEEYNAVLTNIEADMSAIEQDIANYESRVASMDSEMQDLYGSIEGLSNNMLNLQLDIDQANRQAEYEQYLSEVQGSSAAASDATAIQYTGGGFVMPIVAHDGITSYYGPRNIPEAGINDFHFGLDFAADYNTPCMAAAPGTVVHAGWMAYGGNTVKIDIGGGLIIMYCHLNDFAVSVGQVVNAGDVVGYVGSTGNSTGPHLHFEVQAGGEPVDPLNYLQ